MFRLVYILIGYGFGCLQSAYFVGRIFGKIDIRKHGSGNAGMTNIVRVMGAKAGFAVGIFDIVKAIAAYLFVSLLFAKTEADAAQLAGLYAGIGAILGHNFPFFLKFKGGKGVACTIGIILIFDWQVALVVFAIALACVFITKYISLASLLIALLFPIMLIVFKREPEVVLLGFLMMMLCYYQHRANIKRLIQGKENKFTIKKR